MTPFNSVRETDKGIIANRANDVRLRPPIMVGVCVYICL